MLIVLMWRRRQFVFIEDKDEERNKKEVMHRALCELLFYFRNKYLLNQSFMIIFK